MRLILALICSLLIAAGAAAEGDMTGFQELERKARAGDVEAQLEVGILYEFGFGMKDNKIPALAWYMVAADQGNPQAIERRDLLMKQLTDAEIEEARKLSLTLVTRKPRNAGAKPAGSGKPATAKP